MIKLLKLILILAELRRTEILNLTSSEPAHHVYVYPHLCMSNAQ